MDNAELTAYKEFIDDLVQLASSSIEGQRFRKGVWHPEPPPDQVRYNALLSEQKPDQREFLARILDDVRSAAIHDVLSYLTDAEYQLSIDGLVLSSQPFGTFANYDFVCRREGDEWPEIDGSG